MTRSILVAVIAAALGLGLIVAAAPAAGAWIRPPKLTYTIKTLGNGLTVVVLEDHSTPIVNLQLWYHVGSKDERAGRTGFAHLFEHMMFQGSRNVEPEQHPSIISSVGGQSNAYTTEDTTVYWETFPSQYLPLALWLEADRMASLRVDERTFRREREVVKEERRMRVENQPYGRLSEIIYNIAFTTHPYKHPTIGSMADLEAASIEDVRAFYRTYYVPNNACLALVGDVDTADVMALVERYLGRVPKAEAVPRDIPAEPASTAARRATVEEAWPLPAVVVAYHITFDGHPDSYPLHITSKVLSDGQGSRLNQTLVYDTQIALAVSGEGNIIEDPNLFYAVAIVQPGHTPEEAEKALIGEFERLKSELISEQELLRAKNQFARDYMLMRETVQGKAAQLAHAVVIHHGDVTTADGEFDIFANVTRDDVQRVARTYFTPQNRVVITILPKAGAPGGGGTR